MINAYQATPVAYYTWSGEFIHMDCATEEQREAAQAHAKETGVDRDFYRFMEDEYGLSVTSRYDIHEVESQNSYNLEHLPIIAGMQARVEALDQAVMTLDDIERIGPGWTTNLQWDAGNEYLDQVSEELDDMRYDLEQDIEEMVDELSAVLCAECGKRIE